MEFDFEEQRNAWENEQEMRETIEEEICCKCHKEAKGSEVMVYWGDRENPPEYDFVCDSCQSYSA